MSGAETIAGLALAAPPLVISWLEHYRELFQMFGSWRRFRPEYRKIERQLQSLDLSLDLTLEKLFSDYVQNQEELRRLKIDRRDKTWTSVEGKLNQRLLPEVRVLYLGLLQDLQDAIEGLEDLLAYNKADFQTKLEGAIKKVQNTPKSGTDFFSKARNKTLYEVERVKFSTRGKPIQDAMQKIESLLQKIQDLLAQNDEKAERRARDAQKRSQLGLQRTLLGFWRHAHAVYDLISRSWACTCHSQHSADLLLYHRTEPDIQLDILFHYSPVYCVQTNPPWVRHRTRIFRTELPATVKVGRMVNFAPQQGSSGSKKAAMSPILDLCGAIVRLAANQGFVGLLAGHGHSDGYSVANHKDGSITNPTFDPVTLGTLLRKDPWDRPERKTRYRVAAILASSHLQLHCSEWLSHGWSKDNIFFLIRGGEPQLDSPYLRRDFEGVPTKHAEPAFDIGFATLAIVLLELCFGYTLDDSPFRKRYVSTDGTFDLVHDRAAAWDWLEKVEGEADEHYARAVDWCLNRWRVRSEDVTWRKDFYQAVVEPLRVEAGLEQYYDV